MKKYFMVKKTEVVGPTIHMFDSLEKLKDEVYEWDAGSIVYEATEIGKIKYEKKVEIE